MAHPTPSPVEGALTLAGQVERFRADADRGVRSLGFCLSMTAAGFNGTDVSTVPADERDLFLQQRATYSSLSAAVSRDDGQPATQRRRISWVQEVTVTAEMGGQPRQAREEGSQAAAAPQDSAAATAPQDSAAATAPQGSAAAVAPQNSAAAVAPQAAVALDADPKWSTCNWLVNEYPRTTHSRIVVALLYAALGEILGPCQVGGWGSAEHQEVWRDLVGVQEWASLVESVATGLAAHFSAEYNRARLRGGVETDTGYVRTFMQNELLALLPTVGRRVANEILPAARRRAQQVLTEHHLNEVQDDELRRVREDNEQQPVNSPAQDVSPSSYISTESVLHSESPDDNPHHFWDRPGRE